MNKKGPAAWSRNGKRKIGLLTAVLLSAVMIMATVQISTADPLNVDRTDCTLKINPYSESSGFADDLPAANVRIDVYKVADAVKMDGVDAYGYALKDAFKSAEGGEAEADPEDLSLEEALKDENLSKLEGTDWRSLAPKAARIVLEKGLAADVVITAGAEAEDQLTAGLYLLIVQGSRDDSGNAMISGAASDYVFAPELVSIPGKNAAGGGTTMDNPGEWVYNMDVTLKPERNARSSGMGRLQLVKTLQLTDPAAEIKQATFVFHIYITAEGQTEERIVNMDVGPGSSLTNTLDIGEFPEGASVRIVEEYSGATYDVVGSATQEGTITAGGVLQLTFTNTDNGRNRDGYGVENHFEYSSSNGWQWQATPPRVAE